MVGHHIFFTFMQGNKSLSLNNFPLESHSMAASASEICSMCVPDVVDVTLLAVRIVSYRGLTGVVVMGLGAWSVLEGVSVLGWCGVLGF